MYLEHVDAVYFDGDVFLVRFDCHLNRDTKEIADVKRRVSTHANSLVFKHFAWKSKVYDTMFPRHEAKRVVHFRHVPAVTQNVVFGLVFFQKTEFTFGKENAITFRIGTIQFVRLSEPTFELVAAIQTAQHSVENAVVIV